VVVGVLTTRKYLAQQNVIAVALVNRDSLVACRQLLKFANSLSIEVNQMQLGERRLDV